MITLSTSDMIVGTRPDGSFVAILRETVACSCGRAAAIVVNRMGRTRCLACDAAPPAPFVPSNCRYCGWHQTKGHALSCQGAL